MFRKSRDVVRASDLGHSSRETRTKCRRVGTFDRFSRKRPLLIFAGVVLLLTPMEFRSSPQKTKLLDGHLRK